MLCAADIATTPGRAITLSRGAASGTRRVKGSIATMSPSTSRTCVSSHSWSNGEGLFWTSNSQPASRIARSAAALPATEPAVTSTFPSGTTPPSKQPEPWSTL
jgi:hypothetical protein